jgi:hypothetical protein
LVKFMKRYSKIVCQTTTLKWVPNLCTTPNPSNPKWPSPMTELFYVLMLLNSNKFGWSYKWLMLTTNYCKQNYSVLHSEQL